MTINKNPTWCRFCCQNIPYDGCGGVHTCHDHVRSIVNDAMPKKSKKREKLYLQIVSISRRERTYYDF